jgi:5-methylcytosine-specific restriction endonuclease McrA
MEPPSGPSRSAIQLAERLIQLLDRGGFTATYKYAVLVALMDLAMELTSATGLPPEMITTRQLAEKVIELYWLHCAPYDSERRVLRQSTGGDAKPALIVRHILQFRDAVDPGLERSLSLSQARARAAPGRYEGLVREIEWTLVHMPLPRLQLIGGQEDAFLYEYGFTKKTPRGVVDRYQRGESSSFDNRLNLKPGVSAALIALNGVLRPLIYRNWAMMVADMNGLAKEAPLEEFLFGSRRTSLVPVRSALHELQEGRCFYCLKSMAPECHVDHFVPWSRHADNSIDNLVAAHDKCNGRKSDYLAAAEHVERWRERSARHAGSLAAIAREKAWESQAERTFSVARAIYRMLPDDARLWQAGQSFVLIEHPRIAAALAA